jgi:hypothetical protein
MEERKEIGDDEPKEVPVENPHYLFDEFERARHVVIPGITGENLYQFNPKPGVYMVGDYFIEIQLVEGTTSMKGPQMQQVETGPKFIAALIVVTSMKSDMILRAYMHRFQNDGENPFDKLLYIDIGTGQIFHRFTRKNVDVIDELQNLIIEVAEVSDRGMEEEKYPVEKLKKVEDVIYPPYV